MNSDARKALIESARRAFRSRFNLEATHGAVAPGRVNLIGEHTDYNDGFVLPLAIDRQTAVVASQSMSSRSTLVALDLNQTHSVDLRQPLHPLGGSFADYVLGVAAQFTSRGVWVPNLDLLITGDIPRGAGLSSSASLEVAIALLLRQVTGAALTPLEIAQMCQAAEREFVGVPCGIMDMFVIALASRDHALLIDCRSLQYQTLPFPTSGGLSLLVVDTGVERSLRSSEYAERRQSCASAARKLKVPALRDALEDEISGAANLTAVERQQALHVAAENRRVSEAAAALRTGDWRRLGDLMFASHDSLRDLFRVSTAELDLIVDTARSLRNGNAGVLGARMTGAGFGGCAIVLCRSDSVANVECAVADAFRAAFRRAPQVIRAHAAECARALDSDTPDES